MFLYSLIECLQVNRIYVASFCFHSKLVVEIANNPSCELAIQLYCFFQIFYVNLFKREFWISLNEYFERLFHQVLYNNKDVLYLRSYVKQNILGNNSAKKNFSLTLALILLSIQFSATEIFLQQFNICGEKMFDRLASLFQRSSFNHFNWKVVARQLVK